MLFKTLELPSSAYYEYLQLCIAPMVWAFLSTTVQLPATQRKVEGEEREVRESGAYQPPPLFLSHSPPPPPPWLNLNSFQRPRPKARMASIQSLESVVAEFGQLLWSSTYLKWSDRTLMSRVRFLIFPWEMVKIYAPADIWTGRRYFGKLCGYNSRYSTGETPPI